MNYIVFALNATFDGARSIENEIIEIGAVKLDESGTVLDKFNTFIKPVINPQLTHSCKSLTKIKQTDLDEAPDFKEAISSFLSWVGEEEYLLLSWSKYDQAQFVRDCTFHHISHEWTGAHISLKHLFPELKGLPIPVGLRKALALDGLSYLGIKNKAIDDAINVARVFTANFDKWPIRN